MKVICNMILFGAIFYLPTYSVHAGNLNDDNNKERLKTTQLLDSYLNLKDIISEIIKKNDYKEQKQIEIKGYTEWMLYWKKKEK